MASVDMCRDHDWPGSSCPECRKEREEAKNKSSVKRWPEGMVSYGPDHKDFPNAPSDWNQGAVYMTQGYLSTLHRTSDFWKRTNRIVVAYMPIKPGEQPVAETVEDRAREMLIDLIGNQFSDTTLRVATDWLKQERKLAQAEVHNEYRSCLLEPRK